MDLDEIPARKLLEELIRRRELKQKGLCTYCERPVNCLPACRFPERHAGKSEGLKLVTSLVFDDRDEIKPLDL